MTWDPGQYLRFGDHRLRPALELLARVPLEAGEVDRVVDLGAGTGVMLPHLRTRFPAARIEAVDNDPAMLQAARAAAAKPGLDQVELVEADAGAWQPEGAVDLVFSNAALHWLDDHAALLPRLLGWLRPGGVLAIQMPHNFASPSHRLLDEVAHEGPWSARLVPLLREWPVLEPQEYLAILAGDAADVDIWETEYLQILAGEHAVAEWLKGAALRPLLAALDDEPDLRERFWLTFRDRVTAAHPALPDRRTPFPFRRLFVVATRFPDSGAAPIRAKRPADWDR